MQKTSVDSTHDTPAANRWKNHCMDSVAGEKTGYGYWRRWLTRKRREKERETEIVLHGRDYFASPKFDFCPKSIAKLLRRPKIDWL